MEEKNVPGTVLMAAAFPTPDGNSISSSLKLKDIFCSRTCPEIFPKLRLLLGGIIESLQEMRYKCLAPPAPHCL